MPSSTLRSFTLAVTSTTLLKNATSIPVYLVPAAVGKLPRASNRIERHRPRAGCRHASVATPADTSIDNTRGRSPIGDVLPTEAEELVSSSRRREPSAWATLIEPYLPTHLRLADPLPLQQNNESYGSISIHSFYLVLAKARTYANVDLLSYLGVYQNRWDAVIWLVKAMLEQHSRHVSVGNALHQLPSLLWPSAGRSLETITDNPISPVLPCPSQPPLEMLISRGDLNGHRSSAMQTGRDSLGQIWQSLGAIVLQAADRSSEDPSYSAIMSHVFRILAHLHRIEAFPNSIYNYDPAADPTVLRRPPTLYVLSRRIMSILSDLEWGLQWDEVIKKYSELGYEVPKAVLQPKIREFGPELWLDLVLWACVEGGWVTEGAWIVGEMERRKANPETQWSVISWQEICAVESPMPGWFSMLKLEIEQTRMNHIAGFGISTGVPFKVEMGSRTVSREVILTLVDGLINTASTREDNYSARATILPHYLTACQDLLERGHAALSANFLNAIITRIIENANENNPHSLRRLLNWRLRHLHSTGFPSSPSSSAQDHDTDDTAPILGLLHRILHGLARGGNVQGSLSTLTKIQSFVDEKRSKYIEDFADKLRERLKPGEDTADFFFDAENDTPTIHPQIPVNVIVALLDVIVQHRFFDLARWLLHNDDIDGGIIDPKLYFDPKFQPVLLRFATATADDQLLTKVLQQLEPPLSEDVLHAILRCQVVLCKWGAVEELLRHLQRTVGMSWKASDAMAIARAILRLEHDISDAQDRRQISQAQELLQGLVHGKYNSPHHPLQLRDLTETRTANQLGRIFQTLPGSLRTITLRSTDAFARANGSVNITPNAFNLILEAIVQYYGCAAGKKIWERWCLEPRESKRARGRRDEGVEIYPEGERIVIPTLYMLRTVLRPIIEKGTTTSPSGRNKAATKISRQVLGVRKDNIAAAVEQAEGNSEREVHFRLDEEERSVLDWGIMMCKKFGLSAEEIRAEIPGCFSGKEQPKHLLWDRGNSPWHIVSRTASSI